MASLLNFHGARLTMVICRIILLMYGGGKQNAVMIAGFACLCAVSIISGNALLVLIGNVLSLASSYLFALILRLDPMAWYFKPVTSHIMILINSIVLFVIQGIAVGVCLLVKARGKGV